ncbi:hypothetical protein H2508_06795 [Parahaliea sp. F7430]|uniref:Uracil-DNA glycosylase-like domain-containing protein n=1 Tax=Sediminihaliea albiluteola TaxID=2758564 RepID=A0A7W2YIS5_9GAMM|nr:hypothetical protein [Sediminihaliea albiluteola]MBA6412821.1 hypothetical protein [Sediminihaliea albiluteola]
MLTSRALQHSAYLEALGIEQYVSRWDLAGAAPSQRIAVAIAQAPAEAEPPAEALSAKEVSPHKRASLEERPVARAEILARPTVAKSDVKSAVKKPTTTEVLRFNFALITVGPFLWLDNAAGGVLEQRQMNLIMAMARALAAPANRPQVEQFQWPLNNNRQLDHGAEAARAALEGFLLRRVELQQCRAVIVLGELGKSLLADWAPLDVPVVTTLSSAEMMSDPMLKKEVWQDLRKLRLPLQ